jgi:hypothetical protein
MTGEQETGQVAVFNCSQRAEVPLRDLHLVSPYTWYKGPDDTPLTVIQTPEGPKTLDMGRLLIASHPELGRSAGELGFPPGTQLCPPVPYLPSPGHAILAADEGGFVTGIISGSEEAIEDRIIRVLGEAEVKHAREGN